MFVAETQDVDLTMFVGTPVVWMKVGARLRLMRNWVETVAIKWKPR